MEHGEDIDIVNNALMDTVSDFDRVLEQVKHLDTLITLNTPSCKIAIANAVAHFSSNPHQSLEFRFCTNSEFTTERPSIFSSKKSGILVWEEIRKCKAARTTYSDELDSLLLFLRNLNKPDSGIDQDTWQSFEDYCQSISSIELLQFVQHFEWSTQEPDVEDLPAIITQTLQNKFSQSAAISNLIHPRLFLFVISTLSQKGEKILTHKHLAEQLTLPGLDESDRNLLDYLNNEVLAISARLGTLEDNYYSQQQQITAIRRNLLEKEYGPATTFRLEAAIANISMSIPPQVRTISRRQQLIDSVRQSLETADWLSVYGTIGSGKTQFATLLAEHTSSLIYVSFRDLSFDESVVLLQHLRIELQRTEPWKEASRDIDEKGLLILDDVPRFHGGDKIGQQLHSLSTLLNQHQRLLVTLSHYPLPDDVVAFFDIGRVYQLAMPPLTAPEIKEVFERHGFSSDDLAPHFVEKIRNTTSGHPTLVTSFARNARSQGTGSLSSLLETFDDTPVLNDVVSETMAMILRTVERQEHRDLLYRLCVVIGPFGDREISAVSNVEPVLQRRLEAYASLQGLWVETLSNDTSLICPLVSSFGAKELSSQVYIEVAASLASLLLNDVLNPLELVKALRYLNRSQQYVKIGFALLGALDSSDSMTFEWQQFIFTVCNNDEFIQHCPVTLSFFVNAKLMTVADSLGVPIEGIISRVSKLSEITTEKEEWAKVAYAVQCGPILAKSDFSAGIQMCQFVLDNCDLFDIPDVTASDSDQSEESKSYTKENLIGFTPWVYIPQIKGCDDFVIWFEMLINRSNDQLSYIFGNEVAREGFKNVLDRLWMIEHEKSQRDVIPILELYLRLRKFCLE
ncbi:MAG: hypothetical protein R3C11_27625 [Planctomycetaceae bacterium]